MFKWYNYLQQHSCLLERACWFTHVVFQATSSTCTQLHRTDLPPMSPQRDFVYMLCFGFLHTNWFKHYSCWHANTIQYNTHTDGQQRGAAGVIWEVPVALFFLSCINQYVWKMNAAAALCQTQMLHSLHSRPLVPCNEIFEVKVFVKGPVHTIIKGDMERLSSRKLTTDICQVCFTHFPTFSQLEKSAMIHLGSFTTRAFWENCTFFCYVFVLGPMLNYWYTGWDGQYLSHI